MKLHVEVKGTKHEVELTRDGKQLHAVVDGREYQVEASEPEPNVYLLKQNSKVSEVFVSPGKPGEPSMIRIGTNEFEATIIDPKRFRGSAASNEDASGRAEIKTAMPGKLVRILVSAGDAVQKGDGVLVVEAMKMQNEMKAPKDGVVTEIRAKEGATVAAGDILAIID